MSATSVFVVGSLLVVGLSILVREVYQLVCGTSILDKYGTTIKTLIYTLPSRSFITCYNTQKLIWGMQVEFCPFAC